MTPKSPCRRILPFLLATLSSLSAMAQSVPTPPAPATQPVAAALDSFHDAAAKADADRYFGLFAPEGIFMGTDATERWTVETFRTWAAPYFKRKSAWTFVARSRNVILAPAGDVAWFDEVLDNATYGECRGTGTCRRIDGEWKIAHYNLTIPIPNDLADGFVRMIRGGPKTTTIYLARHAEKVQDASLTDPPLTEAGGARARRLAGMLRSTRLAAVFCTEFQRTRDTALPAAAGARLEATLMKAADSKELAARLLSEFAGKTTLAVGHSNTIPLILKALGAKEELTIADDEYDNLFIITIAPTGHVTLQRLHY